MAPRKYTLGKRIESVEETRRRIVDATFDLHNEKGVVATSMQDVAERADVALRTVYNHYPTIDDLVAGCTRKVIALLSPPTPAIFNGLSTLEERMLRLVRELFAMYERGSLQIGVARREQAEVAGLADFVANERAMRQALVGEALRPFDVRQRVVREVVALTDFYVWKAFDDQDLTTHQAVEVVYRSLVALADPDTVGEKGQEEKL
jgi:AcrR family transcriptional regulator